MRRYRCPVTDLLLDVFGLLAALPGDVAPDPWEDPASGGTWVVPAVAAFVVVAVVAAITVAVVLIRRRR